MNDVSSKKILDSLFDGVYFVDCERRITYWNAAAERISGYSKTDMLGHCCADNLLRHVDTSGVDSVSTAVPSPPQSAMENRVRRVSFFIIN